MRDRGVSGKGAAWGRGHLGARALGARAIWLAREWDVGNNLHERTIAVSWTCGFRWGTVECLPVCLDMYKKFLGRNWCWRVASIILHELGDTF